MNIECLKFKSHMSGKLVGFADFDLQDVGITLHGCAVFKNEGRTWVSVPSREYMDGDEKKYHACIRFKDVEDLKAFSKSAVQSIERLYQKQNPPIHNPEPTPMPSDHNEALPF